MDSVARSFVTSPVGDEKLAFFNLIDLAIEAVVSEIAILVIADVDAILLLSRYLSPLRSIVIMH